jgi:hypothetical protein
MRICSELHAAAPCWLLLLSLLASRAALAAGAPVLLLLLQVRALALQQVQQVLQPPQQVHRVHTLLLVLVLAQGQPLASLLLLLLLQDWRQSLKDSPCMKPHTDLAGQPPHPFHRPRLSQLLQAHSCLHCCCQHVPCALQQACQHVQHCLQRLYHWWQVGM